MDDGSPAGSLVILLLFIILNGIFYGFSAAIRVLSESEMERRSRDGDKKAGQILAIMENPVYLVNTIPMIAIFMGILFGVFSVRSFQRIFTPYLTEYPALVLILLLSEIVLVSFGVLSFRKICTYYAERSAYLFITPVHLVMTVWSPITWCVIHLSNLMARLFGIDPTKVDADVTEEDVLSVVDEAHEQGVIEENEAEMIQNIIDFGDKEAKDIMMHRKNIVALDSAMVLDDAIHIMAEESYSRYPVYENDIDNILGIIHLKDVLGVMVDDELACRRTIRDVRGLIRHVEFIPETRSISDLFEAMQAKQIHMVMVADEYGQTSGLVAMEDILEEIVGEIQDEYDEEEENIQEQFDNSLLIDGLTPLEDVGEELGLDFEDEDFETLNGFLTDRLGHIPGNSDWEIIARGYRFQILSIENKVIRQVRAEKIQQKEGEEKCQDIQNLQT